jgi:hypothetical protein
MRLKSSTIDELLIIAVLLSRALLVLSTPWVLFARTAPIDIADSELTYGAKFFGKKSELISKRQNIELTSIF